MNSLTEPGRELRMSNGSDIALLEVFRTGARELRTECEAVTGVTSRFRCSAVRFGSVVGIDSLSASLREMSERVDSTADNGLLESGESGRMTSRLT